MTYNPISWIRALMAGKSLLNNIKEGKMKSGFTTTEFWLTLVSSGGIFWKGVEGVIPQALMLKFIAAVVAAYIIARSLLKIAQVISPFTKTDKDDKFVAGAGQVMDKIDQTFNTPK